MDRTKLWKNFFVLSIACHLFLFLSYVVIVGPFSLPKQPPKQNDLPAYIYQGQNQPLPHRVTPAVNKARPKTVAQDELKKTTSPQGLQHFLPVKPLQLEDKSQQNHTFQPIQPEINTAQLKSFLDAKKKQDPVHLVGEKMLEDPLQKLIGIALTKNLVYPELAARLGIHGIVSVGILLNPDGRIEDITLLKSSREKMLDVAALEGIAACSPIQNTDIYLKEPKRLLINVIFN